MSAAKGPLAAGGSGGGQSQQAVQIVATERGRMMAFHDSEGNTLHATEFDPRWVRQARYPLPAFARR